MSAALNQDFALARFREEAIRRDPALYSTGIVHGVIHVWLSISGNVGWYRPEVSNGELRGLRPECVQGPDEYEDPQWTFHFNYPFRITSPKQRVKIINAVNQHSA
jgi:hypothetical protein